MIAYRLSKSTRGRPQVGGAKPTRLGLYVRVRGVLLALVALVLSGLVVQPTPAAAISIILKDAAPDRIERQRKAAAGTTLPGTPDVSRKAERLAEQEVVPGTPILIRIFKEESELELWMQRGERYVRFATYPVCNWSGTLGPKLAEGDKQSPEGFYSVTRRQLHRSGKWPRSLNLGFPNAHDRSLLRTGSYILVHGGCSSVGCFAMTDAVISEIFALVEASIAAGQEHVPVHVFPFRMSGANLARRQQSPWGGFWEELKAAYDSFELTGVPPRISTCNGRYVVADGRPEEVGHEPPLDFCGEIAANTQASALLQSIASHPYRLQTLSETERQLLQSNESPQQRRVLEKAERLLERHPLPRVRSAGHRRGGLAAANSGPRYTCNPGLASCRKHIALQRKKAPATRLARTTKTSQQARLARTTR